MSTEVIIQQMAVIAILVIIGMYLGKKGIIDAKTEQKLSSIVLDVCNPAMILSCVLSGGITATHTKLLIAILIAIILYVILCILGVLFPYLLGIDSDKRKYYNMMVVYTNVGFIGIAVAKTILSNNGMLYIIVFNIMFGLFFYTHGVKILGGKNERFQWKNLLSPGIIMSLFTLVVFWTGLKLPTVISNSVIYVGNATVFLSMCLLGVSFIKMSVKSCIKDKNIWIYIILRMILFPIVVFFVLKGLGLEMEMVQAFCLEAAMPVANLPLIQAENNGQDTRVLSEGIMVTTVISFFTITALMSFVFV